MAAKKKTATKKPTTRQAELEKRAEERGYQLIRDGDAWYAAIGDKRFGPLRTLDEVEEFLPG